jgi:hypothetical protein
MSLKSEKVNRYWNKTPDAIRYADIDPGVIREFKGTHPAAVQGWLPPADGVFPVNPAYVPTGRDRKRRAVHFLEGLLGKDLSKRHFTTL